MHILLGVHSLVCAILVTKGHDYELEVCRQFACSDKRNGTRQDWFVRLHTHTQACGDLEFLWPLLRAALMKCTPPRCVDSELKVRCCMRECQGGGRSGGARPKHVTSAVASYKLTSTVTSCDSTYTLSCAEAYVSSLYPANHRKLGVHESSKWSSWRHKRCVEDTYRRRNDVNIASMALKMLRGNFNVCLHSITYKVRFTWL